MSNQPKIKNVPFVDKQPKGKPFEVQVIAGADAWNKTKWQTVREWTKAESDYQPIVLGSHQLETLSRLKIPVDVGTVSIYQSGELKEQHKTAICVNLAKYSTACNVAFYDDACQLVENASGYIERLRKDATGTEESGATRSNLNVDVEDYADYFKTLADNEKTADFLKWFGKSIRYNDNGERIYYYTGTHWQAFTESKLIREIIKFHKAHGIKYSEKKLKNIAGLIAYEVDEIGKANPLLLAFKNGTLNKQTREFKPLDEMDFLTSCLPVEYDESNKATPHFDDWLHFVAGGNQVKADTILAALYMILTNRHEWQLFIEVTGVGGSGKSIFNEIAILLSGRDNASQITLRDLESPVIRCKILDKTLIYSADQEAYTGDGAELRAITGGDNITFNPKYSDAFDERVTAVYMMTNNKAIIFKEHNGGVSRRRVIFHFGKAVPPERLDVKLKEKLTQETGGIIIKLLDRFSANPKKAHELLKAQRYSVESTEIKIAYDHILDFAQHFATKTEVNGLIMGSTRKANTPETANQYLYGAYLYYCECSNIKNPLTKMAFKQAFKNAMRELQRGEINTRLKDGRNVTNVYFINYADTLNEWQG